MANHEDLDLIRLFGLSAEEAGGLGLTGSGQVPADATSPIDGLPDRSEPIAGHASAAAVLHGARPGQPAEVHEAAVPPPGVHEGGAGEPAGIRKASRADELALLTMLDGMESST